VTGADLQYVLAADIGLGSRAVIELDAIPIALRFVAQRETHRRIFLVAPVE
jgi:hypothetical protein